MADAVTRSKPATADPRPPEVHLNLNVRGLQPSATLAINERCAELQRQGRHIFKLGLGQSPFPVPAPVVEELRAHAFQRDYLAVKGLAALREAVADYLQRTRQVDAHADDVLIGPGSKELMFLLQLTFYGDLLIPTPSWVSYAPQAHIVGRHVRWIETRRADDWCLTAERLEAFCADDPECPRLVILNYPANPTGATYDAAELEALARVARRHRLVVLSDEIYGELHHEGRHDSIARYYPEGTIISGGLSKWCGAGGWRLGTLVFPRSLRWLLDAMAVVASETYTATSAPIQFAAVRAFCGGPAIEAYLGRSRRILGALGRLLAERLRAAGADVPAPRGGFYLFPDFGPLAGRLGARGITTGPALCERALDEAGVACLPGGDFGRPAAELTARLAYVNFDGGRALAAAERLAADEAIDEAFVRRWCAEPVAAVERLCEWLASG